MNACQWWLGVHQPNWAWDGTARGPVFISARRLRQRKSPYPRATVAIAIDSGGFTELSKFGRWSVGPEQYAAEVRAWSQQLGTVEWAAIQDWMCEPWLLEGGTPPGGGPRAPGTGLTVAEHQRRTIESYLDLRYLAPEIWWLPVLQGYTIGDYRRHMEAYRHAGFDLRGHRLVGVGSVCRRQNVDEVRAIVSTLADCGLRLHGFGLKTRALETVAGSLASADSLAWSFDGRKGTGVRGLRDSHGRSLQNSAEHAEAFRLRMLSLIEAARQSRRPAGGPFGGTPFERRN